MRKSLGEKERGGEGIIITPKLTILACCCGIIVLELKISTVLCENLCMNSLKTFITNSSDLKHIRLSVLIMLNNILKFLLTFLIFPTICYK